jgi:hypothetical protein
MAVTVERHNTGNHADQGEIVAAIEHILAESPGDWRVAIIGSQANDCWDMKIEGPNGFERSYTLEGSAGEHEASVIRARLVRLLPLKAGAMRRS